MNLFERWAGESFATTQEGVLFYPFGTGPGYVVPDASTDLRLRSISVRFHFVAFWTFFVAVLTSFPWWADAVLIIGPLAVYWAVILGATRSLRRAARRRSWRDAFAARVRTRSWGELWSMLGACLALVGLGTVLWGRADTAQRFGVGLWLALWLALTASCLAMLATKRRQAADRVEHHAG
jgi:hypothetical protein